MPGLDSSLALAFSATLSKSLPLWLVPFSVSKVFCMCRQASRQGKIGAGPREDAWWWLQEPGAAMGRPLGLGSRAEVESSYDVCR